MWHVTCDMWHLTCDTWYVTGRGRWAFSQNFIISGLTWPPKYWPHSHWDGYGQRAAIYQVSGSDSTNPHWFLEGIQSRNPIMWTSRIVDTASKNLVDSVWGSGIDIGLWGWQFFKWEYIHQNNKPNKKGFQKDRKCIETIFLAQMYTHA